MRRIRRWGERGVGGRRALGHRLARAIPRGGVLPDDVWRQRHRGIVALLWLHVPALFVMAVVQGNAVGHAALEAAVIAAFALWAMALDRNMTMSTVVASVGLMACSAELVHLSGGLIEMHFHFFVMVGVVTLYQDWRPFLIAIGSVVTHHTVIGLLDPAAVYNHSAAIASPWKWALIHAGFILAMSATGMITWRLNELLLLAGVEREQRLVEAQEIAQMGSWDHELSSGRTTWSSGMRRLLGVDDSVEPSMESLLSVVHPEDLDACRADLALALAGAGTHDLDFRVAAPGGGWRWMHGRAAGAVTSGRGIVSGTIQDISQRRSSEDELRSRERDLRTTLSLLNATLESTADGILVVDTEGRISSYNGRFAEMWSLPDAILHDGDDDAALGHVLGQLQDPDGFVAKVRELYSQPDAESTDTIHFTDGRVVERFSMPQRVAGEVVGRVWSFHDVTDRMRLEHELAHQAFHDSLTGLANQFLFRDRLDHTIARHVRDATTTSAVLFLDLDDFKDVNDSLGHHAGDDLLKAVAQRLLSCLRTADTAARLGGDEFAVILEDVTSIDEVERTAQRVLDALNEPIVLADKAVIATASIGLAVHSAGTSPADLLRNADLAMYAAKRLGKNRFERFVPTMHTAVVERVEIVNDLRGACERAEFTLEYQPIVALDTGELHSVEALIRWEHPTRGLLRPESFISYAEESGLIAEMGTWALEEACAEVRRWHAAYPERDPIGVSVNLSPYQLRMPNLARDVEALLRSAGLPARFLTLELTEGAMMEDTERALARLRELKALGLSLAVDDFGTGYSSLSYLRQFPIDVLKIDRTFVRGIQHGAEESALAHAIVRLARSLGLAAVAEGVENLEQLRWLQRVGCSRAQGFYLARPGSAEVITSLLMDRHPFPGVQTDLFDSERDAPILSFDVPPAGLPSA